MKFFTMFKSALHLSLSRAMPIQSMPNHPTSWRSSLILSSYLRLGLPSCPFPSGFPTKIQCALLMSTYVPHAPSISFFLILSSEYYFVRSTNHKTPRFVVNKSNLSKQEWLILLVLLCHVFNKIRFWTKEGKTNKTYGTVILYFNF
jgi:hypothetical protein